RHWVKVNTWQLCPMWDKWRNGKAQESQEIHPKVAAWALCSRYAGQVACMNEAALGDFPDYEDTENRRNAVACDFDASCEESAARKRGKKGAKPPSEPILTLVWDGAAWRLRVRQFKLAALFLSFLGRFLRRRWAIGSRRWTREHWLSI